ncbi:prepilin-type N-terminal cleavage/methylation domain-containing protein [Acinetobacter nosocomialis]|uniref:GspH/FimT family pseudopilin n=1 Tax=Acinetobacter nosocomialis TaxID=106654 RepID=UPI000B3DA0B7|nr:GspH/FimT family pseudopilin [Acinetobacter nosocomialis]MBD0443166.1 prepilin-type N-terminal cleavage/methylation domain-containing protein [Acinetobacter nosocomialis]MDE9416372.1 prepilin-type N-terminal cleavage/methylation domain-containing protein [Acinetobacter nosocomialis]MDM9639675.1 prepilin-type N-terminal cleavage/methylation domain-containing protein [Acinetobacter nosocomialis]MDQ9041199.1 prepilin-type N-terminal cleavage/methylation domain-containing protein [Acinetobacter 
MRGMIPQEGFTLIELIVTIVVMAIIAVMAVPMFGDMLNNQNLNRSSEDLVSSINQARMKAIVERRQVKVQLNSTYVADSDNQINWVPSGKAQLKTGSNTSIVFLMSGLVKDATGDTTFEICNTVSGNKSKIINVSRMGSIQSITMGTCS